MKKLYYRPYGDQHPFWLKFLFIIVWVSVIFICCAVSFTYFENHAAYFGIPVGLVGGHYIAYYSMYVLYKRFSDVSKDDLYRELEKLKEQKDEEEEIEMIKKMHKETQKDIDKKNNKD